MACHELQDISHMLSWDVLWCGYLMQRESKMYHRAVCWNAKIAKFLMFLITAEMNSYEKKQLLCNPTRELALSRNDFLQGSSFIF